MPSFKDLFSCACFGKDSHHDHPSSPHNVLPPPASSTSSSSYLKAISSTGELPVIDRQQQMVTDSSLNSRIRTESQSMSQSLTQSTSQSTTSRSSSPIYADDRSDTGSTSETHDYTLKTSRAPLCAASYKGHVVDVQNLLLEGANVSEQDDARRSPLHAAAFSGYDNVVELLLKFHADIDARDWNNRTPLFWAAKRGHSHVCRLLIAEGADVTIQDSVGLTALHCLARSGDLINVIEVIENGGDVNAVDNDGRSPLHEAAKSNALGVVQELIRSGACVDRMDKRGHYPVSLATDSQVRAALSNGAAALPDALTGQVAEGPTSGGNGDQNRRGSISRKGKTLPMKRVIPGYSLTPPSTSPRSPPAHAASSPAHAASSLDYSYAANATNARTLHPVPPVLPLSTHSSATNVFAQSNFHNFSRTADGKPLSTLNRR